jgi:C-terminal processing protease CtpA/Prc
MPPVFMGDTAAAAMTFLGNSQALIIDLRQNGGGSPDGVALIASYLFEQAVRMNDIYDRPSNETRQFWTLPYVPGKRFVGKDVYVLTSSRTFSAAEDFTYALKNLKRVTVVGEVTGGGAHPVGPRRISDHFVIVVPMGRSISSITHADWEGVGVEPDIKVLSAQALARAHLTALEKRLPTVTEPPIRAEITAALERVKNELSATKD